MKAKVYLRFAQSETKGFLVRAGNSPSADPIITPREGKDVALPTVAFAVVLDIPDAAFRRAEAVLAEIEVPEGAISVSAQVRDD